METCESEDVHDVVASINAYLRKAIQMNIDSQERLYSQREAIKRSERKVEEVAQEIEKANSLLDRAQRPVTGYLWDQLCAVSAYFKEASKPKPPVSVYAPETMGVDRESISELSESLNRAEEIVRREVLAENQQPGLQETLGLVRQLRGIILANTKEMEDQIASLDTLSSNTSMAIDKTDNLNAQIRKL